MEQKEQLRILNQLLPKEKPELRAQAVRFPREGVAQRRLLRSLMNVRLPMPLSFSQYFRSLP